MFRNIQSFQLSTCYNSVKSFKSQYTWSDNFISLKCHPNVINLRVPHTWSERLHHNRGNTTCHQIESRDIFDRLPCQKTKWLLRPIVRCSTITTCSCLPVAHPATPTCFWGNVPRQSPVKVRSTSYLAQFGINIVENNKCFMFRSRSIKSYLTVRH